MFLSLPARPCVTLNYGIYTPLYRSEVVCIRHRDVYCRASQQRKWGEGWPRRRTRQRQPQLDTKPVSSESAVQQCPDVALEVVTKLAILLGGKNYPLACLPLSVLLYDVLRLKYDPEQVQLKQGYLLNELLDGHPDCSPGRARRRYPWHVWVDCNGIPLDLKREAQAVQRRIRLRAGMPNRIDESVHLLKESLHESPPQDALFVDLHIEDPGYRQLFIADFKKNSNDWEQLTKDLSAGDNTERFWARWAGTEIASFRDSLGLGTEM